MNLVKKHVARKDKTRQLIISCSNPSTQYPWKAEAVSTGTISGAKKHKNIPFPSRKR
jgi:hypothetical protein